MKIDSVMSPCPYTVDANLPVVEGKQMMESMDFRHLLVSDNDTLLGILTLSDVELALAVRKELEPIPSAGQVCAKRFVVVPRDSKVAHVAKEMAQEKLDCAVIIDEEEKAVGIFTTTDACRVLYLALE